MNDLISWLRAQLDADEQDARAAQDGDGYAEWDTPSTGVVQVAAGDLDGLVLAPRNAAIHIANNDPARVLRQVQAHRAILDYRAEQADGAGYNQREGDYEHEAEYSLRLEALDRVVRDLASIYSDRDGYKEEWSA